MSALTNQTAGAEPRAELALGQLSKPPHRHRRNLVLWAAVATGLGLLASLGITISKKWTATHHDEFPVAQVEKGNVSFTINAKGSLRGGNPETLIAPPTGGTELHLTYLAKNGSRVDAGDVVARFDTTEQEYKSKEAEADVAEAEQKIIQARANRDAQKEEDSYALIKARNDLTLAELEVRKNPLLAAITAKENNLALDAARQHLKQFSRISQIVRRPATPESQRRKPAKRRLHRKRKLLKKTLRR